MNLSWINERKRGGATEMRKTQVTPKLTYPCNASTHLMGTCHAHELYPFSYTPNLSPLQTILWIACRQTLWEKNLAPSQAIQGRLWDANPRWCQSVCELMVRLCLILFIRRGHMTSQYQVKVKDILQLFLRKFHTREFPTKLHTCRHMCEYF